MRIEPNVKLLSKWMISLLVPGLILLIPIDQNFTSSLRLFFVITVLVILIIAFELLPQLIAAFLLPSLYFISGLVPMNVAFQSWTSSTVWMVLGGLLLSSILEECGLLKRIAYYVIGKCGGTYKGAVFGCFFIGLALNLVTFCYGWLVASALVYGICKAMNLKPSRESSLLCFAGTIGATGSTIFLYYPGYYALIEDSIRMVQGDYTMSMIETFKYNGVGLLLYVLALLILLKAYKTKELDRQFQNNIFKKKYKDLGPLSRKEKYAVLMVLVLLVYLFSSRFTNYPAAYGFMLIPILAFLPGVNIADKKITEKINFPMVFFVSACLGIGIVGAEVGFGKFLTDVALPLLSGKSPLVASIAFMLFGAIANFFMTPFAMLGGLSLPFAQIAVSLGMNPVAVVMILLYSCEILLLPYQSAGNLMMYAFGMMPMGDFIKQQGLKAVLMISGFILIIYPLWNLLGYI